MTDAERDLEKMQRGYNGVLVHLLWLRHFHPFASRIRIRRTPHGLRSIILDRAQKEEAET